MTDAELVAFLTWAVPRLGLRWEGLRNFRRTVRKRLARRMRELDLATLAGYRAHLEAAPTEWARLDSMCRITISRLYRDREVYDLLATEILPERAKSAAREGRSTIGVWSAGCASGEEPYSVAIAWHVEVAPTHPAIALELLATDADDDLLTRARRGTYEEASLRELDPRLRAAALTREGEDGDANLSSIRPELRAGITFRCEDLRRTMPGGPFDVVLCRNVVLTYIEATKQRALLEAMIERLLPRGVLMVGSRETLPEPAAALGLVARIPGVFVRSER